MDSAGLDGNDAYHRRRGVGVVRTRDGCVAPPATAISHSSTAGIGRQAPWRVDPEGGVWTCPPPSSRAGIENHAQDKKKKGKRRAGRGRSGAAGEKSVTHGHDGGDGNGTRTTSMGFGGAGDAGIGGTEDAVITHQKEEDLDKAQVGWACVLNFSTAIDCAIVTALSGCADYPSVSCCLSSIYIVVAFSC